VSDEKTSPAGVGLFSVIRDAVRFSLELRKQTPWCRVEVDRSYRSRPSQSKYYTKLLTNGQFSQCDTQVEQLGQEQLLMISSTRMMKATVVIEK
jgi:hypothetical protein